VKAPGPFGGAVGKTLRCGQRRTLHARAAERRDPYAILERHCPTRLDLKAFNRLLGQRSNDLVNIAAISAGRFLTLALLVLDDFKQPCCGPAELAELRCEHEVVDAVSVEILVDEVLDLVVPGHPDNFKLERFLHELSDLCKLESNSLDCCAQIIDSGTVPPSRQDTGS
jgi:hypothetical protein